MKTKADKHREAGTLAQFRARQAASREGTARYQQRMVGLPLLPSPTDAIQRAIELGADAANYLRDWQDGDTSQWP
jgi:hypothetical protein